MYRAPLRSCHRILQVTRRQTVSRRFASTAPADRKGTWKGTAFRWCLVGGAVYWYNTSPIFAEEPAPRTIPAPPQFSESDLPTVDAVVEEKRRQAEAAAPKATPLPATLEQPVNSGATDAAVTEPIGTQSPEELEEDAGQQGAFNPETGEINWDCPCLGGMADGPCGDEFRAAFSCFVYSSEEPKGMDCIDKFQHMQDCFRKYPEIYSAELADDEETGEQSTQDSAAAGDAPAERSSESAPQVTNDETSTSETTPKIKEETDGSGSLSRPESGAVGAARDTKDVDETATAKNPSNAAKKNDETKL